MKKVYLIYVCLKILIFITFSSYAQSIQWAQNMGKNLAYTSGKSIATDKFDNIYTVGTFNTSFDINYGIDTLMLYNKGDDDCFILKTDTYGKFQWALAIGGKYNETPHCVSLDDSGYIYISGTFQDTVDFDPGTGLSILTSVGTNIFVLKLNSNGDFIWAKSLPVGLTYSKTAIEIDNNGDVIVSGSFLSNTDFDPGIGVYTLQPTNNSSTLFVLKLSGQGNFIFVKKLGIGTTYSMCLDTAGNIYSTGTFSATSDFDPDTSVYNLIRTSSNNSYILKLNNNGGFVWVKGIAGQTASIAADDSNNVYTTGTFRRKVNFNPNNLNDTFVAFGYTDFFILKLDLYGNYMWADVFGGTSSEDVQSIQVDKFGNLITVGSFGDVVDFDPSNNVLSYISNGNGADIFLLKLKNDGKLINVKKMGGYGTDMGYDIAIDKSNSQIITGYIGSKNPDFDSIPGNYSLSVNGVEDLFIAKFSDCNLKIIKQPASKTIIVGENTFFSTISSIPSAKFQWQFLTKNGFVDIKNNEQYFGTNSDSFYIINASQSMDNNKFRCVINYEGCSTFSDTVTLKANCNFSISKQPLSQVTSVDKQAVFSIFFSGKMVDKQWQTLSGLSFINMIDDSNYLGTKQDSLIVLKANLNQDKSKFRCISTLNNCTLVSDTISLTVKCDKLINYEPVNRPIKPGEDIIYVVGVTNRHSVFQWQIGDKYMDYFTNLNISPSIKGVQDDSLIILGSYPLMNNTESFRCIVSDRGCIDTSSIVAIYFVGNKELENLTYSVYPNPVTNYLTINKGNSSPELSYQIYDIIGSEIMSGYLNNSKNLLDFTFLKNGIYILCLNDESNTRVKIVKEN